MSQILFRFFLIYFACHLLHIICLSAFTRPQLKVYILRKFLRCGRYYSATVQAAARQVVLRLALPGVFTGTLPCLPRTSSGRAGTLSPPGYHKPVERRSFATCRSPTLPLRFCLTWSTPFASFRYVRGALPQATELTRSASVAYFVPHFRQPQDGQLVGGCQSCNINITVFDIIRNYSHGSEELFLTSCCRAYNSILCQIRGAHCKPLKAFSVLFRGTVLPTHPPAGFFLIVEGFLSFRLLDCITLIIVLRISTDEKTSALRLDSVPGCRLPLFPLPVCFAPAAGSSRQPVIRPLNDRYRATP